MPYVKMETEKAKQLIDKYTNGTASAEECRVVESWYLKMQGGETLSAVELEKEHELGMHELDRYFVQRSKRTLMLRITSAAAVLLIVAAGFWVNTYQHRGIKDRITLAQDIPPGKRTAILVLDNGDTISLNDVKHGLAISKDAITYDDGTSVHRGKVAETMINASTPRGGTYDLTLSDGTVVSLNSESLLRFPQVFKGHSRVVELMGEAYFQVAKNKAMPFIVKSAGQSVEVLGTHFNINSYAGAVSSTTLVEGSVKIQAGTAERILIPGQQADVRADGLLVKQADVEAVISWKDGYFRFNDESIQEIMLKVARWYDVEVVYDGEVTKEGFTGAISRFSNISDVLDMLERTKTVHFKLEGRRVTVLN